MKFSVVIVNYNVKYYLEQCLCSLYRAIDNLSAEIFVVDNASVDDSEAYLTERFPRVTYIYNEENVGFARANNQAIRQAKGEYVLLLNPDTVADFGRSASVYGHASLRRSCRCENADG